MEHVHHPIQVSNLLLNFTDLDATYFLKFWLRFTTALPQIQQVPRVNQ